MSSRPWLRAALPLLVLVALTAALSAPVYAARILQPTTSDYDAHIVWTLRVLKGQLPPTYVIAHPGFQLFLGFLYWAGRGRLGLWEAAVLVQVLAQVAAALLLYFGIGPIPRRWGEPLRVFLALSLTLVAPLMLLAPLDGKFYFGYIGLASYHNPTVHLLRPFALASFFFALRAFARPRSPAWMVVLSALCMLAGMLVKPNYAIALLPALGVLTLWFVWRRRTLDWWMLLAGQVLPALAVLAFQALLIYWVPEANHAGVMISPFGVESLWSGYLPLKFLLSILFPLAAALLTWPRLHEDSGLQLAWLAFFFAVLQLYFLAESGPRYREANFRWGAQVALFLLFAVSLKEVLRMALAQELARSRRLALSALYLLHLLAGIAYYIYAFVQVGYA